MRPDTPLQRLRISSLRELDALVGTRLTHETPLTQWEESRTNVLFPTVEEAIEAMHDPHFRQFKGADDHVMCGDQEGEPFRGELVNLLPEITTRFRVHAGRGFIEQEEPWLVNEAGSEGETLFPAP